MTQFWRKEASKEGQDGNIKKKDAKYTKWEHLIPSLGSVHGKPTVPMCCFFVSGQLTNTVISLCLHATKDIYIMNGHIEQTFDQIIISCYQFSVNCGLHHFRLFIL